MLAMLVALPDDAKLLLSGAVGAAILWLLLWLSTYFKVDLAGYAAPLAALVTPVIVFVIEMGLGFINPSLDALVLTVIHFLVLLMGSLGVFFGLFRRVFRKNSSLR